MMEMCVSFFFVILNRGIIRGRWSVGTRKVIFDDVGVLIVLVVKVAVVVVRGSMWSYR